MGRYGIVKGFTWNFGDDLGIQGPDDAYKIFETMNDRGLSLTPTDLLKTFLLRSIKDEEKRGELNDFWKERIYELKETDQLVVIADERPYQLSS